MAGTGWVIANHAGTYHRRETGRPLVTREQRTPPHTPTTAFMTSLSRHLPLAARGRSPPTLAPRLRRRAGQPTPPRSRAARMNQAAQPQSEHRLHLSESALARQCRWRFRVTVGGASAQETRLGSMARATRSPRRQCWSPSDVLHVKGRDIRRSSCASLTQWHVADHSITSSRLRRGTSHLKSSTSQPFTFWYCVCSCPLAGERRANSQESDTGD